MEVIVTSLFVDDQDKALAFYTDMLGFVKKHDEPVGEYRWIALVSPENQEGTELLLEPKNHPASREYQEKIYSEGIPATMFGVADVHSEFERLKEKGVRFSMEPTPAGDMIIAVLDDTCGNLIQLIEQ